MRVKRGVTSRAKHKKILKQAKGMQSYRRKSYRHAKQANIKALSYAYRDRRNKKRDFRSLWISRINAASRELGLSYGQLINNLKKSNIKINRKMLADIAVSEPKAFKAIVEQSTK